MIRAHFHCLPHGSTLHRTGECDTVGGLHGIDGWQCGKELEEVSEEVARLELLMGQLAVDDMIIAGLLWGTTIDDLNPHAETSWLPK